MIPICVLFFTHECLSLSITCSLFSLKLFCFAANVFLLLDPCHSSLCILLYTLNTNCKQEFSKSTRLGLGDDNIKNTRDQTATLQIQDQHTFLLYFFSSPACVKSLSVCSVFLSVAVIPIFVMIFTQYLPLSVTCSPLLSNSNALLLMFYCCHSSLCILLSTLRCPLDCQCPRMKQEQFVVKMVGMHQFCKPMGSLTASCKCNFKRWITSLQIVDYS